MVRGQVTQVVLQIEIPTFENISRDRLEKESTQEGGNTQERDHVDRACSSEAGRENGEGRSRNPRNPFEALRYETGLYTGFRHIVKKS